MLELRMKYFVLTLSFLFVSNTTYAQAIQFIVVCNQTSQKLEVVLPVDTVSSNYEVIKRKLPNRTVAEQWIVKNYPDGRCSEPKVEKAKPAPPKTAGTEQGATASNSPTPLKAISHYYRNKVQLMGGWTRFDLVSLPEFRHVQDGGYYFGIRYQNGNAVQIGGVIDYNYYGSVRSYLDEEDWEEVRWANVDFAMIVSVPVELHKASGQIWFLPEVGIGPSWQNVLEAKPQDWEVNALGGGWSWQLKASVELFHIAFSVEYKRLFNQTIEDNDVFRMNGLKLGLGLSL